MEVVSVQAKAGAGATGRKGNERRANTEKRRKDQEGSGGRRGSVRPNNSLPFRVDDEFLTFRMKGETILR